MKHASRFLFILCLITGGPWAFAQGPVNPCYWSGSVVRCFPPTGLFLDNGRSLELGNPSGNLVQVTAASPSATYSLILPPAQGGASTFLSNNGSGVLSWLLPTYPVTSISGTAPITVSPTTGAAVVSLQTPLATTYGGTGVAGSANFPSSGNVATYPVPTASLSGIYVASVAGVSPITVTGTTQAAVAINQAGTSSSGYLSSTDWNTFNNKQATITTVPAASLSGVVATTNGGTGVNGTANFPSSGNIATYPVPTASLSGTVALTSQVSGVLPIANGGTNANNSQSAINNLSQLTTLGDLEYFNGTNTTRLPVGANNYVLTASSGAVGGIAWEPTSTAGTGTVTSVAFTGAGGIFSVTGSPVTSSGTITESVAGTSGGVPYFSSSSQLSSSLALGAGKVVLGGGAGVAPYVATAGATNTVLTWNGTAASFGAVILGSPAAVQVNVSGASAPATTIGEAICSYSAGGIGVAGGTANLGQITLTAGDWDVWAWAEVTSAGGTSTTQVLSIVGVGNVSQTFLSGSQTQQFMQGFAVSGTIRQVSAPYILRTSSNLVVYGVVQEATVTAGGLTSQTIDNASYICARRRS